MRAKQFCLGQRFGTSKMDLRPPLLRGLGCCPFSIGGSVGVDILFIVAPIVCGVSVFSSYFVIQYFMSF